jgi:hypothetical protein
MKKVGSNHSLVWEFIISLEFMWTTKERNCLLRGLFLNAGL